METSPVDLSQARINIGSYPTSATPSSSKVSEEIVDEEEAEKISQMEDSLK
jgi:hypothetical protein